MSNENFKEFYQLDLSALAEKLKTSSSGLSRGFAAERLQEVGFNQLREERKRSVWQMAYEQYRNPMIILLLIAAFISWLLGELKDTFVILMIVLLNGLIGFIQEYRAEKALSALKQLAAPFATVRRGGQFQQISAAELVPGDLLSLDSGAIVPADLRLNEVHALKVDESPLTGESIAIEKTAETLDQAGLPLSDRRNMAYRGTRVTYGHGVVL
ncbi:cation-transporting P-type ATPase [uncultured Desulfuromusa sp.]|uniref:P-type ATPase n=1 Tax=uncultured Desulfuromusa sp. TaxID=219183 RepID=UPI002AA83309|nr:cation-transporting P-type ATPase [uncultured Desulfuromusa sp.]